MDASGYFATARERYQIKLRREAGQPFPWTDDPVFQKYRFCHVHREDDRTTKWLREHVRDPLSKIGNKLRIVESILIFRWFNRVETGEFVEDLLISGWNTEEARSRLADVRPIVTGAYMIKTEYGMNKLDGVLYLIEKALPKLPRMIEHWGTTLEEPTDDLTLISGIGRFLAYEIVTDLRWTPVLNQATDVMKWANAGPGCAHGLGLVYNNEKWQWNRAKEEHRAEMNTFMQELLVMSQDPANWPAEWPQWEMRTVEHWACEFFKWHTGHEGKRLKRRFRE
jgi:hypothetical protein